MISTPAAPTYLPHSSTPAVSSASAANNDSTPTHLLSPAPSVASRSSNKWGRFFARRSREATPSIAASRAPSFAPPTVSAVPSIAPSLAPSIGKSLQDFEEEATFNKQLVHELEVELQAYEKQVEDLKSVIRNDGEKIESLTRDSAGFADEARKSQKEAKTLKKRVAELKKMIESLEDELAAKTHQIRQLESMECFANPSDMLNAEHLASEVESLKGQVTHFSILLIAKEDEVNTLKAAYDAEVGTLRDQLSNVQANADSKTKQLAETEARFKTLLNTKENSDEDLEFEQATNRDLQEQLVRLQDDLDFKNACNASQKRKLREVEAEVEDLEKQLAASKEKPQAPTELDETVIVKAQLDAASTELTELRDTIRKQNEESAHLRATIRKLEVAVEQAESKAEQANNTITSITHQNNLLNHENNALALAIASADRDLSDQSTTFRKLQRKIARLQTQCHAALTTSNLHDLSIFEKHKHDRELLEAKLRAKTLRVEELEDKLESVEKGTAKDEAEREGKIVSMEDDLRRLRLDIDGEVAKRTAELEWQIDHLKAQHANNTTTSTNADASQDEIAQLKTQMLSLKQGHEQEQVARAAELRGQAERIAALEADKEELVLQRNFLRMMRGADGCKKEVREQAVRIAELEKEKEELELRRNFLKRLRGVDVGVVAN